MLIVEVPPLQTPDCQNGVLNHSRPPRKTIWLSTPFFGTKARSQSFLSPSTHEQHPCFLSVIDRNGTVSREKLRSVRRHPKKPLFDTASAKAPGQASIHSSSQMGN